MARGAEKNPLPTAPTVGGAFSVHCRPITTAAAGEQHPRVSRLTRVSRNPAPSTTSTGAPARIVHASSHPAPAEPVPAASFLPTRGTPRPRNPRQAPLHQQRGSTPLVSRLNPPLPAEPPPCPGVREKTRARGTCTRQLPNKSTSWQPSHPHPVSAALAYTLYSLPPLASLPPYPGGKPKTTSTGTHPVTRLTPPHPVSATLHPRNPPARIVPVHHPA